ncbi:MAG: XrtA/PEP-CTERM system exopolysaccharide export protein [Thiohalomonadales bacterium]
MIFIRNILLLALVFSTACTSMPEEVESDLAVTTLRLDNSNLIAVYKIGVDDVIRVNVWKNPELTTEVPVRPDGMISVPLIGDVKAAGLSPEEVSANIKVKLQKFVRDPLVAVILTQLNSHEYLSRVRVTGAVRTPISLPYRQGMTVLDAVLAAGGVNDFASAGSTKLYRRIKDKSNAISIDLDDILQGGKLNTNYILKPGDIITVPERIF